jgi:hypothetical protein
LTEPPNDDCPYVLVPTPRWICTERTELARSAKFEK